MGIDPNANDINNTYGGGNYQNVGIFYDSYNRWKKTQALKNLARINSQFTDVSTVGDTAVTFEGKTYTYDTGTGKWSVWLEDLLEDSILYHINRDTGENFDLRDDTAGDGVKDPDDAFPDDPTESVDTDGDGVGDNSDVAPNDPDTQTQAQIDQREQERLD